MSQLIKYVEELIKQKSAIVAGKVVPTQTYERAVELYPALDEAFATDELSPYLAKFNAKIKKYGIQYNPGSTKTKFVGGCTECRTVTEIISKICENYGCVADNFVNKHESTDCNSFIVWKLNPAADLVTLQDKDTETVQDIRSTTDPTQQCFTVIMKAVNVQEIVLKRAMCECSALDVLLIALQSITLSVGKAVDRAILYGNYDPTANGGTGGYIAVSNFDSIDLLIPSSQKLTSSGTIATFTKIVDAIANIQDVTNCGIEDIKVLMRQGVKTRMNGALDNNNRPIATELQAMGVDCTTLRIACAEAIPCQSVKYAKNAGTGVVTTDIWVGLKNDYAFGHYLMGTTEPIPDFRTNNRYLLQQNTYVGGKLLNTGSFYKIVATL